jgi:probable addiction module antidote protein
MIFNRPKIIWPTTGVDMGTRKSPKLKTWSQLKQERFRNDPNEAFEYLRASLEENADMPEAIVEAIRSVSESLDMSVEKLAKKSKIQPSTLYKALGKEGNPNLGTLISILKAMGLRPSVEKVS